MNWDINNDGAVTISDMWLFAKGILQLPGNAAIEFLDGTTVGTFFEISRADVNSGTATVFSVVLWLVLAFLIAWVIDSS